MTQTYTVNGCAIMRGMDAWVVRRKGEHLGERDTVVEAEKLANDTPEPLCYTATARHSLVRKLTEAARDFGLSVKGTDVYGEPDIW